MTEQEKWVRFKIGDALPADSTIARFVTGLALIETDLLDAHVPMVRYSEDAVDTSPEVTSLFWDAASRVREAVKFIVDAGKDPDVAKFIESLPEDAQLAFNAILSSAEPWEGSFVQRITKPIRDQRFHYPRVVDAVWEEALQESSESVSGIRMRGDAVSGSRSIFADEVRGRILARHLGETLEELRENLKGVSDLSANVVLLSQTAVGEYLLRLPDGVLDISELEQ